MDPVVQERMFCLLSAPAPRKKTLRGDVNSRSLSGGLPVFFHYHGSVESASPKNERKRHSWEGKGKTVTKHQFLGSMLIFGGVLLEIHLFFTEP